MNPFSSDSATDKVGRGRKRQPSEAGAQAAQRVSKPSGGRPQPLQAKKPGEQPSLGHPNLQQSGAPDDSAQPGDFRHLQVVAQHFNIAGQGREATFANWLNLSGYYRQFAKPGRVPFSIFEDGR